MNKILHHFWLVILIMHGVLSAYPHAITHIPSEDLGDSLLNYVQARYLSAASNVPLLYRALFDECIQLSYQAQSYDAKKSQYEQTITISDDASLLRFFDIIRTPESPRTLFTVASIKDHHLLSEIQTMSSDVFFNIPWKNHAVEDHLCQSMHVSATVGSLYDDAAHIVGIFRGKQDADVLKEPPLQYYRAQIQRVIDWNNNKPLFFVLFDEQDSSKSFMQSIRSFIDPSYELMHISLSTCSPAEKISNMLQSDIFIGTQSSLACAIALIGQFDAIFMPVHYQNTDANRWIDCVQIITKGHKWLAYPFNLVLRDYN